MRQVPAPDGDLGSPPLPPPAPAGSPLAGPGAWAPLRKETHACSRIGLRHVVGDGGPRGSRTAPPGGRHTGGGEPQARGIGHQGTRGSGRRPRRRACVSSPNHAKGLFALLPSTHAHPRPPKPGEGVPDGTEWRRGQDPGGHGAQSLWAPPSTGGRGSPHTDAPCGPPPRGRSHPHLLPGLCWPPPPPASEERKQTSTGCFWENKGARTDAAPGAAEGPRARQAQGWAGGRARLKGRRWI